MVQSTVEFFIHNNVMIIQFGFAILFFLAVFVILKSFRAEKEAAPAVGYERASLREEAKSAAPAPAPVAGEDTSPLDDLDNLDDLMAMEEKPTAAAPAPAAEAPATAEPAVAAALSADMQKAIEEKEKLISDMKAEMSALQEKLKSQSDPKAFESKIKELSDKLAEYEIIEDDIANLSFYKNENAKLKNEIEKVKGAIPDIDVPVAAAEIAPPSKLDPIMAPTAAAPGPVDNSVLEEFEKAVQQKEALEKNIPEAAAPAAKPNLKVAPPPAPVAEAPAESPIAVDPAKLVQEVESLAAAPAPTVQDDSGKDNTQKLIEEFENFMNKASS